VIAAFPLPSGSPHLAYLAQIFIARQPLRPDIAMLPNPRSATRWNRDFQGLPLRFLSLLQKLITRAL